MMLEMRPLSGFENYTPDRFEANLRTRGGSAYWGNDLSEIIDHAKREAMKINEICVAIIEDQSYPKAIGVEGKNGNYWRFMFFNARLCHRTDEGAVHVTIRDMRGPDALNEYWDEFYLQYSPGERV